MENYILFILIILNVSTGTAQLDIQLDTVSSVKGSTVSITSKVNEYRDITLGYEVLSWNSDSISLDSIKVTNQSLQHHLLLYDTSGIDTGRVRLLWFDTLGNNYTIAFNNDVYRFYFHVNGESKILCEKLSPFDNNAILKASDCSNQGLVRINYSTPALGLDWINVEGECSGGKSMVFWQTLDEYNLNYFVLEESIDGYNWKDREIINPKGEGHQITTYEVIFTSIRSMRYYRIRAVENTGKYDLSKIIALDCGSTNSFTPFIYPNPSITGKVEIVMPKLENANITIINSIGQKVKEHDGLTTQEGDIVPINITLESGVYRIVVEDKNKKHSFNLIISN